MLEGCWMLDQTVYSKRPANVQEIGDNITEEYAIGVDIAVFLEQMVERLQLRKGLGDPEVWSVLPGCISMSYHIFHRQYNSLV